MTSRCPFLLDHPNHPATTCRPATADLSPALVKAFCLNYTGAFYSLPEDYRLEVYYRSKAADLNLNEPEIDFALALSNSRALREVAYKSLYDYCADIQFRYEQSIDEILYILLYNDLHLSVSEATLLTRYCEQHYHREPKREPAPRTFTQLLTDKTPVSAPPTGLVATPADQGTAYHRAE